MVSIYKLLKLQAIADLRGGLVALEGMNNVPFEIKRVYYLYGTQSGVRRGLHAHKKLKQLAVCVHGSCKFLLDKGNNEKTVIALSEVNQGLYLEGLIWHEMFDFSPDCVLMVLADAHYNESDYIRNYDEFIKLISAGTL